MYLPQVDNNYNICAQITMAVGAFLEPLVVVSLLFGGAWFNRNKEYNFWEGTQGWAGGSSTSHKRRDDVGIKHGSTTEFVTPRSPTWSSGSSSPILSGDDESPWSLTSRRRKIQVFGYKKMITTPNTLIFKDRFLSRVLQKFPFLVEAWYWALIYWVCRASDSSTLTAFLSVNMSELIFHGLLL